MTTNIVVIGAPGAGKGTRISMAKEMMPNIASISTGDLIRKRGIDTSSGKLISNDVVMQILKEELDTLKVDIAIFDGVPRTVEQAELMKKYGIKIYRVIHLSLQEEVAIERALDRVVCPNCSATYTKSAFKHPKKEGLCDKCGIELVRRSDDNRETILERMRVYREKTEPVLEWYESKNVPIITVNPEDDFTVFLEALKD